MFGNSKVPFNKTKKGQKEFELAQKSKERNDRLMTEQAQLAKAEKDQASGYKKQFFQPNKIVAKTESAIKEQKRIAGLIEGHISEQLAQIVVESLRLDEEYMEAHKGRLTEKATDLFKGMFDANILNFNCFEQSNVKSGKRILENSKSFVFNQESSNDQFLNESISEDTAKLVGESSEIILQKLVITVQNERDNSAHLEESAGLPRHIQKKKEKETMTFWKAVNVFVAKENMSIVDESFSESDMELHNEQNIVESMVLFQQISLLETVGVIEPSKLLMRKVQNSLVNFNKKI